MSFPKSIKMRKLFILWLLLAAIPGAKAQLSIYDCNLYEPVSQVDLGPTLIDCHSPCVFLDGTYNFGGNFKKRIRANNSIEVFPGFTSGPFDGLGGMTLELVPAKSDFDVAVMNYTSLSGILKYEKFELGVTPPAAVLEKINNFVGDSASGPKINPYLDWEIRVVGEFMKDGDTIKIDGFYSRDYTSAMVSTLPLPANAGTSLHPYYTDEEYWALGTWTEVSSDYPFRIRFAPPQLGKYKCRVKIYLGTTDVYESDEFPFKVVESGNPGYLKADYGERFLSYNSRTFFPIGCNMPWPVTSGPRDPELHEYLKAEYNGNWGLRPEDYRNYYVVPRVYDKYKETLSAMADSGANYFRTIMYPTCTEIEWEKLGDYSKRLYMAQEMDKILELAENKDIFLHWDMQIHYTLQYSPAAYYKLWTWEYQTIDNEKFCYRDLVSPDNPTDSPLMFFTHEEAKRYYKQRLRYILSRYGYSTSIGLFELFCEISNVGSSDNDISTYYMDGSNWEIYRNWQVEMADYLKTFYNGRVHIVTSNYVGSKHLNDNTFTAPSMDVMTSNIYDFDKPDFSNGYLNKFVAKSMLNDDCLNIHNVSYTSECYPSSFNIKPMIFSESGPVHIETACPNNYVETNRFMWESLFSGLAGALDWCAWDQTGNYGVFRPMSQFMSQFEYLADEHWHPGASEYVDYGGTELWMYKANWADDMEGPRADVAYLRSGDGNYAIGVITNKTFNGRNQDGECMVNLWNLVGSDLEIPITVSSDDEGLRLRGLHADKYYINYFYPPNLSVPFHSSDDIGPRVKLEVEIPGTQEGYIVLFMARRQNYSWLSNANSENSAITNFELIAEEFSEDEGAKRNEIKVFPVPSSNIVNIVADAENLPIQVQVISVDGKSLLGFTIYSDKFELDISGLERGAYILSFDMGNGGMITKKIMKI